MLAMDIPIAGMAGLILAEGGKDLVRSSDRFKTTFLRVFVLMYAAIFIAPTPVYYFLGWPAWEVNFLWPWVDRVLDHPLRAAFSYALLACAVLPTWAGFELGRRWLLRGKDRWVRIGYIALFLLTGLIILLLWDITFNVYSTFERYEAGDGYPFWSHPFVTGWAITSIYFWGSLIGSYVWLRRKGREGTS